MKFRPHGTGCTRGQPEMASIDEKTADAKRNTLMAGPDAEGHFGLFG